LTDQPLASEHGRQPSIAKGRPPGGQPSERAAEPPLIDGDGVVLVDAAAGPCGRPADQPHRVVGTQRQDDLPSRLRAEGSKAEAFFCDFELHGQAPDHPLQLGDAVLVFDPLALALEEGLQPFEGDVLPAGDEFGLQLVLPGGLSRGPPPREDLEDDLGLEPRSERPASAFQHGRTLLGGQY
jgi:hypothetical protein